MAIRVEPNWGPTNGTDWGVAIDDRGEVKDEPIYFAANNGAYGSLEIHEAVELIADLQNAISAIEEARVAKLEELKDSLPTESGLYVHPRFVEGGSLSGATIFALSPSGIWTEVTGEDRKVDTETVLLFKNIWGGLARLSAQGVVS